MKRVTLNIRIGTAICLSLYLGLAACGRDEPRSASLAQLRDAPQHFNGARVRSCGMVRGFDNPEHYWLEDRHLNRVGLPNSATVAAAARQDSPMIVTGRFQQRRDGGRHLEDIELEPGACEAAAPAE